MAFFLGLTFDFGTTGSHDIYIKNQLLQSYLSICNDDRQKVIIPYVVCELNIVFLYVKWMVYISYYVRCYMSFSFLVKCMRCDLLQC